MTIGKRVLVCGGRYYPDGVLVYNVLTFLSRAWGRFSLVVHGDAGEEDEETGIVYCGADKLAGFWAAMSGVPVKAYPYPKEHGRAGGPIRNRWMLEREKPDVVIAFPGGRGTRNMVSISLTAGVPVYAVRQIGGAIRRIRTIEEFD